MHDLPTALSTDDGLALHLRHWPHPAARATVLIVHGLGEHGRRHATLAAELNAAGYAACAPDLRGHGRSGGRRGDIARRDALLRDLARVIDALQAARPGPVLLLGHSLGGLIAARYLAGELDSPQPAWWREVEALVLSSPALDPGMSGAQRALVALMGRLAPHVAVSNGLDPDWISRDPAVVAAYRADPLVHDRVTAMLARFIAESGPEVLAVARRWRRPTLLMWGGADRCVEPGGSARFAAAAPQRVLTAQDWPALSHEIFNEPECAQVFARLREWLAQRAP
jgi:alpha-beta hydrolase superfamily lysophospholipase